MSTPEDDGLVEFSAVRSDTGEDIDLDDLTGPKGDKGDDGAPGRDGTPQDVVEVAQPLIDAQSVDDHADLDLHLNDDRDPANADYPDLIYRNRDDVADGGSPRWEADQGEFIATLVSTLDVAGQAFDLATKAKPGQSVAVPSVVTGSSALFTVPPEGEFFEVVAFIPGVTSFTIAKPTATNGRKHVRIGVGFQVPVTVSFSGVITPRGAPFALTTTGPGNSIVDLIYNATYGLWVAVDAAYSAATVVPGITGSVQRATEVRATDHLDATFVGAAGDPPDSSEWIVGIGRTTLGGGNQEYVASGAVLDGAGNARIRLTREVTPDGNPDPAYQFTSGQMVSRARFEPGVRISARLKLPAYTDGAIAVFYTLGMNNAEEFVNGNASSARDSDPAYRYPPFAFWPKSGEIDIFEADTSATEVAQNVNVATAESLRGAKPGVPTYASGYGDPTFARTVIETADLTAGFHDFAVEWRHDSLTYFIDGAQTNRYTAEEERAAGRDWPFAKHSQFLVLQMGVFGDISPEFTSAEMLVQSVRVESLAMLALGGGLRRGTPFEWDNNTSYFKGDLVNHFGTFLALVDAPFIRDDLDPYDDPRWLALGSYIDPAAIDAFSAALMALNQGAVDEAAAREAADVALGERMDAGAGWKAGRWYATPGQATSGGSSAGLVQAVPIDSPPGGQRIDRVGLAVYGVGNPGTTSVIAIYDDDGGYPGSLVYTSPPIPLDGGETFVSVVVDAVLPAGRAWLGEVNMTGGGATLRRVVGAQRGLRFDTHDAADSQNSVVGFYAQGLAQGTVPDVFPAGAVPNDSLTRTSVRAA